MNSGLTCEKLKMDLRRHAYKKDKSQVKQKAEQVKRMKSSHATGLLNTLLFPASLSGHTEVSHPFLAG